MLLSWPLVCLSGTRMCINVNASHWPLDRIMGQFDTAQICTIFLKGTLSYRLETVQKRFIPIYWPPYTIYNHSNIFRLTYEYIGLFISPSGISDICGTVAGVVTPKGSMSTEGETLHISVLTLTGARYVHPWWRGRCQSYNQVPATHVALCGRNFITCSSFGVRDQASHPCKTTGKIMVLFALYSFE